MKIALINEDSQADKNKLIYQVLSGVASKYGHEVMNYGMFSQKEEHEIGFTKIGILASVLLDTNAADFIVTGCGTGQGAMISCNAFQNVTCGYVATPLDAYLFTQVNAGNAISIPFAQYFGWGAEINLTYIFEKIFQQEFGNGYPSMYAEGEKRSRIFLQEKIKKPSQYQVTEALRRLDQTMLQELLDYPAFKENFYLHAKECETTTFIKTLLE